MRWKWESRFIIDLPDDWEVREPGDTVELLPPHNGGAGHISYLLREREGPLSASELDELVAWFAEKRGQKPNIRHQQYGPYMSAEAHFQTVEDDEAMYWDVCAVGWDNAVCLCSFCCGDEGKNMSTVAMKTFRSITPDNG